MSATAESGELPLFPLNTVLFPGGPLQLRIFEARYLDMVRNCMRNGLGFGVVLIRSGAEVGPAEFHQLGTLARITDFDQLPDGLLGLSAVGERRFRVESAWLQADGLNVGKVTWLDAAPACAMPEDMRHLQALLDELLPQAGAVYEKLERHPDDATWVSYRLAEILPLTPASRQFCLELDDPLKRLQLLAGCLTPAQR